MEHSKYDVLVFCLSAKGHYLTIQRSLACDPGRFGDIHFECDGQGWGGYDVIESIELHDAQLRISLSPERSEDFDGRFEYEVDLALSASDIGAASAFLQRIFSGTSLLTKA